LPGIFSAVHIFGWIPEIFVNNQTVEVIPRRKELAQLALEGSDPFSCRLTGKNQGNISLLASLPHRNLQLTRIASKLGASEWQEESATLTNVTLAPTLRCHRL
jgi:hypothetical protein